MLRSIKFSLSIFLVILLLLSFAACGKSNSNSKENNNSNQTNSTIYNPNITDNQNINSNKGTNAQNNAQRKKSFVEISSTGQIPYDKIDYYKTPFGLETTDINLFPFNYSSKYGFIDANGNVVISEKYDNVHVFSEGKAFVKYNNEWLIIDKNGNELFKVPTEYNEYLDVHNNKKFENGKALCAYFSYEESSSILNILAINADMTTSQTKINTNSKADYRIINTPEFAGVITEDIYVEYDSANTRVEKITYKLSDLAGNTLWETTSLYETFSKAEKLEYNRALAPTLNYSILDSFKVENGYINVFNENFKWGLLNLTTGEITVDYVYDYTGTYSDNLLNVCSYGKWGYVDLNGQKVLDFNYRYTEKFVNGKAIVIMEDNSFKIIDKSGQICFDCGFNYLPPSGTQCRYRIYTDLQEKGIILVWTHYNEKYYIVDISGSTKIIDKCPIYYTAIASPNNMYLGKKMLAIM